MRRKRLFALFIIFAVMATGCGLFPKEEVMPEAPVLPTYKMKEYEKVSVIRGDVVESISVKCTYKAYRTEKLRFGVEGAFFDHVYVNEGDYVKKGDILADLEMDNITQQIDELHNNIVLMELKLANENELRQLAVKSQSRLKNITGYSSELDAKYDTEISNYENRIKELSDTLYIEQKRLEQLHEDTKKYQIIAGIDGIVSLIVDFKEGETSSPQATFMSIYDPETLVFITDGKNSDMFELGQAATVTIAEDEYQTVVIEPEDIIKEETTDGKQEVYLQVEDKANLLKSGDTGYIEFILNERKNVLYLPLKAVYEDNKKPIVYVEDEDKFKSIKEVEIGLVADKKVEIVSGLQEGDSVILD